LSLSIRLLTFVLTSRSLMPLSASGVVV